MGMNQRLSWSRSLTFFFAVVSLITASASGELRAKGSPHGVIQVKSGKSVGAAVQRSSEPLILWCQAVETTDRHPIKINNATFTSPTRTYVAAINRDGKTANMTASDVPVTEAGKWKCLLETDKGTATGFIDVHLRPIIFSRHSLRVEPRDTSEFHFDGSGVTVLKGDNAELTCPVYGRPEPRVQWRLEGTNHAIKESEQYKFNGTTLIIQNATYDNEKTYICVAVNKFMDSVTKREVSYDLFLEKKLRVKSPLAWIWPSLLICAILATLVLIIGLCECRKRRNEQKLLIADPEDE